MCRADPVPAWSKAEIPVLAPVPLGHQDHPSLHLHTPSLPCFVFSTEPSPSVHSLLLRLLPKAGMSVYFVHYCIPSPWHIVGA